MADATAVPWLTDIVEAIARLRQEIEHMPLEAFKADHVRQWFAERGIQIVSEASRRLPDELKARHPTIAWDKVAAIGNVLRREYRTISAPLIWEVVRDHLHELERVCREELARATEPPGPRVKPIIIGSAEDVLVEKKRGWWRR